MVSAGCHSFLLHHSLEANKQKAIIFKKSKLSHNGAEALVEFVKIDLLIPLFSVPVQRQHSSLIVRLGRHQAASAFLHCPQENRGSRGHRARASLTEGPGARPCACGSHSDPVSSERANEVAHDLPQLQFLHPTRPEIFQGPRVSVLSMHRSFSMRLFPKHSKLSVSIACAPHPVFAVTRDLKVSKGCAQTGPVASAVKYYKRGLKPIPRPVLGGLLSPSVR